MEFLGAGQQPGGIEDKADRPQLEQNVQIAVVRVGHLIKLTAGRGPETPEPMPQQGVPLHNWEQINPSIRAARQGFITTKQGTERSDVRAAEERRRKPETDQRQHKDQQGDS